VTDADDPLHGTSRGFTDFYAALGIRPDAPQSAIEAAYRARLAELQADPERADDREQQLLLDDAYRVLSDPARRAEYDRLKQRRTAPRTGPRPIPVNDTIVQSWSLLTTYPRETILPMLGVQLPVAAVVAIVITVLYLSYFSDEPFRTPGELLSEGSSGPLFMVVVATAVQGLFAQVARGATIASVASLKDGRRLSLAAALDPAFSRMGGLLLIAIMLIAGTAVLLATVVGIVLVPYLLLRFGIAFEAYVLEGVSPGQAFRRSWNLTAGNTLRFLGIMLIVLALALGPLFIISALGSISMGGRTADILLNGLLSVVQAGLTAPLFAFITVVTTTFYLQARANANAHPAR
jgi:hypothetical protein